MSRFKIRPSFFNSLLLIGCLGWLVAGGIVVAAVVLLTYDTVSTLERKARTGDATAQYRLGRLYERGAGVKKDVKEAFGWYHLAANNGSAGAMLAIGRAYDDGVGGSSKPDRALTWYRAAVAAGSPGAHLRMANMYARGRGVPKNRRAVWAWRLKAVRASYRNVVTSTIITCRTAIRTVRTGIAGVHETLTLLGEQMSLMRANINPH